jgi:hypothetical protein
VGVAVLAEGWGLVCGENPGEEMYEELGSPEAAQRRQDGAVREFPEVSLDVERQAVGVCPKQFLRPIYAAV